PVAGPKVLARGPVGDDRGAAGLPVHRHRDALEALLLLELLEHLGLELADGLLDALGRKPGVATQSGVHFTLLSDRSLPGPGGAGQVKRDRRRGPPRRWSGPTPASTGRRSRGRSPPARPSGSGRRWAWPCGWPGCR